MKESECYSKILLRIWLLMRSIINIYLTKILNCDSLINCCVHEYADRVDFNAFSELGKENDLLRPN